jgi:hypothetical protein
MIMFSNPSAQASEKDSVRDSPSADFRARVDNSVCWGSILPL